MILDHGGITPAITLRGVFPNSCRLRLDTETTQIKLRIIVIINCYPCFSPEIEVSGIFERDSIFFIGQLWHKMTLYIILHNTPILLTL